MIVTSKETGGIHPLPLLLEVGRQGGGEVEPLLAQHLAVGPVPALPEAHHLLLAQLLVLPALQEGRGLLGRCR